MPEVQKSGSQVTQKSLQSSLVTYEKGLKTYNHLPA